LCGTVDIAISFLRRIARDTSRENVYIALATNGLLHTGNFLASPGMHGPGGQPSGTPVVPQSPVSVFVFPSTALELSTNVKFDLPVRVQGQKATFP